MQKYKILIVIILTLTIAAGGFWYFNKNSGEKGRTAFETGFTLLDDEKNLIWTEAVELAPEARLQFENQIEKIKADLAVAKEKEQLLADYNNLAIYEKYLGHYRQSYDAYLESLKLESRARVAWQNLADVLLKVKAFKSAEFAYKKAIELNQYIPESYVKLADYYKAIGDGKKAEATYKLGLEAIKKSTEGDTLVLNDYAHWLAEQKRYEEAIEIWRQLEKKQPENKEAIERRIEGLRR
ncbi:MAG: hypothetical protein HYV53_01090 [Parcubacteria group bacterium]|nr:hypothetical protein [Parcubacteria group bacterium]